MVPTEGDRHFLAVCRYVERNALRANLVTRAEEWRWSSVGQHVRDHDYVALAEWPVERPLDWLAQLNNPASTAEAEVAERTHARKKPIGRPLTR